MIETDRLISAAPASVQEEVIERALRPKALDEYVGQEKVRGQLSIFIEAARKRKEALDHVLLFGPPGLIFWTPDGTQSDYQVIGFEKAEKFLASIDAALGK